MKVHLRALGCRLNQAEIDALARQFHQQGHEIVEDATQADQMVVNTCAVTVDAGRSSRQLVRELHRANAAAQIAVTGCYAQIAPSDIQVLPGVSHIINNAEKDHLTERLTGQASEPFDHEPLERGARFGAGGRTRAFVKVQDGCDHACTFCITTIARGDNRSRPLDEIVAEVRYLTALGYQEAVLTGVQLGGYGRERGERDGLKQLVAALLADTDMPRIRLSSLEPWDIPDGFFALWESPRLCRHVHLPLQSGCADTLKRMRRRATPDTYRALLDDMRGHVPQMKITTDVIVGFPAESDAEFAESQAFIHQMNFAGLHVFRYSLRPGTPAAKLRGQVREEVKKTRSAALLSDADALERRYAESFVGETGSVLWEQVSGVTPQGFMNVGYTEYYVRVRCVHPRPLTDHITPALLGAWNAADGSMSATPQLEARTEV